MAEIIKSIEAITKLVTSIPSLLGVIGALVCYRFATSDLWYVVMTYLVILLIGRVSVIAWQNYKEDRRQKENLQYYQAKNKERKAKETQIIKDRTKVFFLTLSNTNLEKLMAVYNFKGESTGNCNERIVPSDDFQLYVNAKEILGLGLNNDLSLINSDSDYYSHSNSPIHIWFHPYLYALMKNYAENEIKDYPKDYKV